MNYIGNQFVATDTVRTPSIKSATGNLLLSQWPNSTFNMLKFGGTTNAFPAIKRSGTTLSFRKADDSAYANIEVGNLTVHGSQTGGGGGGGGIDYQQVADPGTVGAGKTWLRTVADSGFSAVNNYGFGLFVRNPSNDGWKAVAPVVYECR